MTNKQKLQSQLEKLEFRRLELFELKKPIDEELVKNYGLLKELQEKIDEIEIKELKTKSLEEKIKFYLIEEDSSTIRYNESNKFFTSLGLNVSGYWVDTNQRVIQICMRQGDENSLKTHYESLNLILPYIKYDAQGYRKLQIFEYTLSESCTHRLGVKENGQCRLFYGSYRHLDFATLKDALKYVQEHHYYYEKKRDDAI